MKDRIFKSKNIYNAFGKTILEIPKIYLCGYSFTKILLGIFLAMQTVTLNLLFDGLATYVTGELSETKLLLIIGLFFICAVMIEIINGINNVMYKDLRVRINNKIASRINFKLAKVEPIEYENPEFQNLLMKAKEGASKGIVALDVLHSVILAYVPYFLILMFYMYNLTPILSLSIGVVFLPIFFSYFVKAKEEKKLEDVIAPINRKYGCYEKHICDKEYFKETRSLGAFSFFMDKLKDVTYELNRAKQIKAKKEMIVDIFLNALTLIGYAFIIGLLTQSVLNGRITIGAFGAIWGSLSRIIGMMEEMICWNIGKAIPKIGLVVRLEEFLTYEEMSTGEKEIASVRTIRLQDVSFKYPGTKENALEKITFEINAGETVAIVGTNGSGKSTLLKLLAGLYLPDTGEIYLDENEIRTVKRYSLFKMITGVFQDFVRYKMSLYDNVIISNINRPQDLKMVKKLLDNVDVDENIFPNKIETILSNEFGGVDISGGQWQRIAIARGVHKSSQIVLLDEPTSAIDPMEESNLYKKFEEMCKGKAALVVTHRLGLTKIAKKIIVLDGGKIVQQGTHQELISQDGKYREMYRAQSQEYFNGKNVC